MSENNTLTIKIEPRASDMSLRDYFAAAAMNGILSNTDTMRQCVRLARAMDAAAMPRMSAVLAFAYADAMLKERTR